MKKKKSLNQHPGNASESEGGERSERERSEGRGAEPPISAAREARGALHGLKLHEMDRALAYPRGPVEHPWAGAPASFASVVEIESLTLSVIRRAGSGAPWLPAVGATAHRSLAHLREGTRHGPRRERSDLVADESLVGDVWTYRFSARALRRYGVAGCVAPTLSALSARVQSVDIARDLRLDAWDFDAGQIARWVVGSKFVQTFVAEDAQAVVAGLHSSGVVMTYYRRADMAADRVCYRLAGRMLARIGGATPGSLLGGVNDAWRVASRHIYVTNSEGSGEHSLWPTGPEFSRVNGGG